MKRKKKHNIKERGISTVVASVLTVLLVVVAVGIVWGVILPTINKNVNIERSNVRLEVVTHGGYTFCDPATEILHIQVKRGSDQADLSSLIFLVIINGNSISYSTDINEVEWEVPAPNEEKTYLLNVSKFIYGACDVIDSVSIIPVFDDGSEGESSFSLSEEVEEGASPTPEKDKEEAANSDTSASSSDDVPEEADEDVPEEVDENIYISSCQILNESGKTYVLNNSLSGAEVTGNCINIRANDIVFDCRGNSIINNNLKASVVYTHYTKRVTVKNCHVEAWVGSGYSDYYASYGMKIYGDDNYVLNNTIKSAGSGIYAYGYNNLIEGNLIENTIKALGFRKDNNTALDNVVRNNKKAQGWALSVWTGVGNKFVGNTISGNRYGMVLYGAPNTLIQCDSYSGNSVLDLYLYAGNNGNMEFNSVGYSKIYVGSGATYVENNSFVC